MLYESGFSRETNQWDIYLPTLSIDTCLLTFLSLERFTVRNWLLRFWRLRNPEIYHLQAGDPGKLMVYIAVRV